MPVVAQICFLFSDFLEDWVNDPPYDPISNYVVTKTFKSAIEILARVSHYSIECFE